MARNFKTGTSAVMSLDVMTSRFENMLSRVNNMIKGDNTYSVWIRLVIGKSEKYQIVFDTSSTNKDENLMLSLDYEKCGAGQGNKFTFKVAFDLFNYGQETKKNVEKLDELLYKAMNITEYTEAIDRLYCKFQYGYNVVGNTQIVSPLYEGLITEIVPTINYSNGKTYYTISGNSIITSMGIDYTFNQIGNQTDKTGSWNGLDLVLWILWYYHGNEATRNELPRDYSGNKDNQHPDVLKGINAKLNIDIPKELMDGASNVYMPTMSKMSPIDYCKEVLSKTVNMNDSRFNGDKDNPDYDLEDENDFRPYYTLYITDSGGSGVSTVHVTFISSKDEENNMNQTHPINFNFEWFNRTNGIVLGWQPNVNVMTYLVARAQKEHDKLMLEAKKDNELKENEEKIDSVINAIPKPPTDTSKLIYTTHPSTIYNNVVSALTGIKNANSKRITAMYDDKIKQLSDTSNLEYYKSKLTLVGIPSDIPIGALLSIKPKILESMSRTQGKYYTLGAKDSISTNGLFVTNIELVRLKNYNE